ncbi:MAG TPA: hypothetical protein VK254_04350 [Candidatus Bathyarchaeia archaeon]|nr:hypothetical protein [Candidatus Bathyarchaeia archaeon]
MKKNKKIILFLIFALSFFSPFSTFAYTFNVGPYETEIDVNEILQEANTGGISSITSQLENRYGINNDIWRTAERKESAPRAEIFFDNTNPKPGEKVTAHAIPEFFKNDPQNLYYTWYIIHTLDGKIQTATNSIADGKREASGIMSRGDYDPNLDGQTYADPGNDPENDGWPAVDANSYDEDEVAAPMGGADGVGGLAEGNDNIEPYDNAGEYCATKGKHTLSDCNLNTDKSAFNQYFTLKSDQSGDYCTACQSSLSFTSTLSSDNQCCYSIQYPDPADPGYLPYDANVEHCPSSYDSTYESCFDYDSLEATNSNLISHCLEDEFDSCEDDWDSLHRDPSGNEPVSQVSRCYAHNFGTNNPDLGFRGYSGSTNNFYEDESGKDSTTDCVHEWKDAPGYTSGSGKFPTGEEEYWKTDPTDPDTDGDGTRDEGDVIGLNQQSFTWSYQPGDRVGVVVEGTSMIPVDEQSAYYKIMWGYLDVCDSTKTGLMDKDECDSSSDHGFGFLATEAPNEQGDDKLKLSLSFSPNNPLADPSAENKENIASDGTISDADQITVTSSIDNTNDNPNSLYYTWQIQKGDPQTNNWGSPLDIDSNFNTTSPPTGMGISQLSFTPKKSALSGNADINYFKVTLTASRAADLTAGRGRSSVIIPVNTKGVKITLHKVDIQNGKAVVGEEICNDGLYKSLCPVVKGQMLAAKVSGSNYKSSDSTFSWTVDGTPAYPPANASQLLDGWSNTTIFFPITKEEREIENISVTATSKNSLQPATGTRLATVVHPAVFIKSGDTSLSWPKVYTTEDPNQKFSYQSIESSDAYEALTNNQASYYLDFVPYYLLGTDTNTQTNWSVNGTDITSPDFYANNPYLGQIGLDYDGRTLKLPTGDTSGAFTTLSASVKKYWSDDERSIAYSAWGVVPDTLSGNSSISIQTLSAPTSDAISSSQNPGQLLAAIGTHLPHYFMYLLRLVLTMVVMFVASAGFYGLTQNLKLADEEK